MPGKWGRGPQSVDLDASPTYSHDRVLIEEKEGGRLPADARSRREDPRARSTHAFPDDLELFRPIGHQPHVKEGAIPHLIERASDDALWEACSRGDGHAFSVIYERYANTIYNYLLRRLADWSEAEDLTAVVFLEAFRRRKEAVVDEGKLLPWLYGIATNVLRNRRRAQFRHRRLLAQLEARPHAAEPDAELRAEAAARMRDVLHRVARLSREQQDVVALCVWSDLSYAEAAVALGVPIGTIRSRLARARTALTELDGGSRHLEVETEFERAGEK